MSAIVTFLNEIDLSEIDGANIIYVDRFFEQTTGSLSEIKNLKLNDFRLLIIYDKIILGYKVNNFNIKYKVSKNENK